MTLTRPSPTYTIIPPPTCLIRRIMKITTTFNEDKRSLHNIHTTPGLSNRDLFPRERRPNDI